jgi:hypothetical protein
MLSSAEKFRSVFAHRVKAVELPGARESWLVSEFSGETTNVERQPGGFDREPTPVDSPHVERHAGCSEATTRMVLTLDGEDARRLQRMAVARGQTPTELVTQLVRDADRSVRFEQLAPPSREPIDRLLDHVNVLGDPAEWAPSTPFDSLAQAVLDAVWSINVRGGMFWRDIERRDKPRVLTPPGIPHTTWLRSSTRSADRTHSPRSFAIVSEHRQAAESSRRRPSGSLPAYSLPPV